MQLDLSTYIQLKGNIINDHFLFLFRYNVFLVCFCSLKCFIALEWIQSCHHLHAKWTLMKERWFKQHDGLFVFFFLCGYAVFFSFVLFFAFGFLFCFFLLFSLRKKRKKYCYVDMTCIVWCLLFIFWKFIPDARIRCLTYLYELQLGNKAIIYLEK